MIMNKFQTLQRENIANQLLNLSQLFFEVTDACNPPYHEN